MNMQIDVVMKRARGYWFVDGFIEMAAGGLFILLAGIHPPQRLFPGNLFPSWFLSMAGEVATRQAFRHPDSCPGLVVAERPLYLSTHRVCEGEPGYDGTGISHISGIRSSSCSCPSPDC